MQCTSVLTKCNLEGTLPTLYTCRSMGMLSGRAAENPRQRANSNINFPDWHYVRSSEHSSVLQTDTEGMPTCHVVVSHNGCRLGCDTVYSGRRVSSFQTNMLPLISGSRSYTFVTEVACSCL
jgi:hypothetical protein